MKVCSQPSNITLPLNMHMIVCSNLGHFKIELLSFLWAIAGEIVVESWLHAPSRLLSELGALQCDLAMESEDIAREQAVKNKVELMALDQLSNDARRASQFKSWDEKWNGDTMEVKMLELSEGIKKSEVLTKVLKNMLAGLKGDKS